jgi:hypothetical protein
MRIDRSVKLTAAAFFGLSLTACNQLHVQEAVLSTKQRVAMVSTSGDGVSPPTNAVFYEGKRGYFVPVATGFGQAPVPAFLNGAGAGVAVGIGNYAGAKALRPDHVNVNQSATATGGAGGAGGKGTGIKLNLGNPCGIKGCPSL